MQFPYKSCLYTILCKATCPRRQITTRGGTEKGAASVTPFYCILLQFPNNPSFQPEKAVIPRPSTLLAPVSLSVATSSRNPTASSTMLNLRLMATSS